ncbi:MAG: Pycsar system effector family protein, partial [Bacteroidota bacterium]
KGTLHAANYAGMQLDDFRLEFQRIMKTGKNTYDEIITDLYFLGKAIRIKQRLVVTSTTLFLVGLSIFMGHVLIHRYAI